MTTNDIAAIRTLTDAYDLQGDAEVIFDEDRYYRGYAAKAHNLGRHVPALCDEVEQLRAENAELRKVVEAAQAWAEMCDDGGIAPYDARTIEDALYHAIEQYRLMDVALTSARNEQAEVSR